MIYLFIADIHIKLGQRNVPIDWQKNRFKLLVDAINSETTHDKVIIGGDLLDVADPSIEEVGLMYEFLKGIKKPIILIPGNHEMVNKTTDCYTHVETMLKDLNVVVHRTFVTEDGIDYIPYNVIKKEFTSSGARVAVTHVRGEIPPHVTPEIDLELFKDYEVVLAGDLHAKSNSQKNILYPGSPMTTSFHRNRAKNENGFILLNSSTASTTWVALDLPQLIRASVSSESEMVKTTYDHTIYELHGSLEELAKVKNPELLDKKVTQDIGAPPTLSMSGGMTGELAEYLTEVKGIKDPAEYVTLFTEIIGNDND